MDTFLLRIHEHCIVIQIQNNIFISKMFYLQVIVRHNGLSKTHWEHHGVSKDTPTSLKVKIVIALQVLRFIQLDKLLKVVRFKIVKFVSSKLLAQNVSLAIMLKTYKDFIIASLALIPQLTVHNVLITMALVMFAIKDIFCHCHHILAILQL